MPEPDAVGKYLFGEVRRVIENHVRLESDWMYAVSALFVMQSYVVSTLPRVFYLMIGGRFGRGKTNFLSLLMSLTNGKSFENVSVAALARELKDGATIGIDEYDVVRERDVQEVRDALVRGGYRANAAPYTRYNAAKKENEHFPVFGPKCLTFRGGVEDALQSRGYIVSMGEVEGEEGYQYVLRNMFPRLDGVPEHLAAWGAATSGAWGRERVQEIMENGGAENVRKAVQVFGGNRDSELATVSCALAEVIGMDLLSQLRQASEARTMAIAASQDSDVDLCREIVLSLTGSTVQAAIDASEKTTQLRQKDIRKAFDDARKMRGDRRMSDSAFAAIRRELGVKDGWLTRPQGAITWSMPSPWLTSLTRLTSTHMETGEPSEPSESTPSLPSETVARAFWDEDATDSVRFAIAHAGPEATSEEVAAPVAKALGFSLDDVKGKVTAIRQAMAEGRAR